MNRSMRTGAAATFAAALALLAGGCGGSESTDGGRGGSPERSLIVPVPPSRSPRPATTATAAPAGSGPTYALSGKLCEKADLSPLADLYPKEDPNPLVNTQKLCVTSLESAQRSVSLTIDADLARDEQFAKLFVETGRRRTSLPTTDVAGAGSDAFYVRADNRVKLTSYHGNLVLQVEALVAAEDGLPRDIVDRLVKVAAGTYARLSP